VYFGFVGVEREEKEMSGIKASGEHSKRKLSIANNPDICTVTDDRL
jgi:Ni,Fe-hydrogenase III component G